MNQSTYHCQVRLQDFFAARRLAAAAVHDLREAGYDRAADCLEDDLDRCLTIYAFPEAHWIHLRTTNPIESIFATVRLRANAAKRFKKTKSGVCLMLRSIVCRLVSGRQQHAVNGRIARARFRPSASARPAGRACHRRSDHHRHILKSILIHLIALGVPDFVGYAGYEVKPFQMGPRFLDVPDANRMNNLV